MDGFTTRKLFDQKKFGDYKVPTHIAEKKKTFYSSQKDLTQRLANTLTERRAIALDPQIAKSHSQRLFNKLETCGKRAMENKQQELERIKELNKKQD